MQDSPIIEYLKIVLPTTISLLAAIFSILTYRRNRRLDNENYIYKVKQESYAKILFELGVVIDILQKFISKSKYFLEEKHGMLEVECEEILDRIDAIGEQYEDAIVSLNNIIITNTLVVPKAVVDKIESLSELLFSLDVPIADDKDLLAIIKNLDLGLDKIIELANQINDEMRLDIKIEDINIHLYKRLKA